MANTDLHLVSGSEPEGIVPARQEDHIAEVMAHTLSESVAAPNNALDLAINLHDATEVPFGELASLGSAFASLPSAFRTVTTTVTTEGKFLQAFDAAGNLLDPSALQQFNDGSGLLGSFRDAANGLHQARLKEVGSAVQQVSQTMPYDPTSLAVAAALMEINKKLDDIKELQQEMMDYLKDKDKAEQRANLKTLADILDAYRFNAGSEIFKKGKYIQVQSIRQDAEKSIIFYRSQTKRELGKKKFLMTDGAVDSQMASVVADLMEYRLALYLYAFSTFLETMLLGNFDAAYIESLVGKIRDYAYSYQELYTKCYNELENSSSKSLQSLAQHGLAFAAVGLGQAIEATPVGDNTQIDETLIGFGRKTHKENKAKTSEKLQNQLIGVKDPGVRPFVENLAQVNRLYNCPALILTDGESAYIVTQKSA